MHGKRENRVLGKVTDVAHLQMVLIEGFAAVTVGALVFASHDPSSVRSAVSMGVLVSLFILLPVIEIWTIECEESVG